MFEDKDISNLGVGVGQVCSFVLMTPPPLIVLGHTFQDFRLSLHLPPPLPDKLGCCNLEQDLPSLLASVFIKLQRTGHSFLFVEVGSYRF